MTSPRLLSNRYEIGDTLGYGGMSEVHRGRDIRLGRDVAVKVLRADLARDPTFQLRFRREAQNAAALNHPAIVAVYDTGETDSDNGPLPYIVMEYVDGRTLRDIVKSEGPLPSRRAMEVMADASAALDFSHRHGIVHRDVKPANIMITRSGAVKVMDFGIARALADSQVVTQTAAVIGTAQYLSPEQARGESVDARSDVYAAGCVLFELLTGEPPFTGDSPVAVAYQHVREDPRKPSDLNPQVPASLDAVVLKALSKNPANRYQSAAEMRADLVRVLSGQRPKAPMIMTEAERTSMLAQPSATEVMMHTGRHRALQRSDEDVLDEPPPRRGARKWLIALVVVVCLAVLVLAAYLASTLLNGQQSVHVVAVPNFEGMRRQEAIAQAQRGGWQVVPTECNSTPDKVDTVVKQTPAPPAEIIKSRDRIELCMGIGPRQVTVPDLTGMTVPQAWQALDRAGLHLGYQQTVETDDPNLVNKIMDWDSKGEMVAEGTTVNVTVGKAPNKKTVPDVRNLSFTQAKQILESNGFTVGRNVVQSDQPAETVIDENPPPNSSVKAGTMVTLTVSNGSAITMPSLVGMTVQDARRALQQAGWNGEIHEVSQPTADLRMNNKVVSSTPGAGQKLGKDQTVTLYVGDYSTNPSSPPTSGVFPFG